MSGKWARSSALLAVDQLIADLGGNVEAAFAHAGISVAALQQPELPLPAQAVVELFESAAEHCRCDSFGLQLACRQTLAVIGPLWQLAQCAPDIRTLLQQLEQFFQHVTSGAQVSLEQGSDGVALCYSLASGVSPRDRHTIELGLGLLCREIRRHCGPRWQPKSVQLRHSPPREQDWHRQIFGSKLFFNQERNAVHFDQATLQQPLIDGRQQCQQLLQQLQQEARPDIALQTEKLLRDMLPFFRCSLPMLAQALGCSTRTLQRNLAAAGTSVQDLRDQVRGSLLLSGRGRPHVQTGVLKFTVVVANQGVQLYSSFSGEPQQSTVIQGVQVAAHQQAVIGGVVTLAPIAASEVGSFKGLRDRASADRAAATACAEHGFSECRLLWAHFDLGEALNALLKIGPIR